MHAYLLCYSMLHQISELCDTCTRGTNLDETLQDKKYFIIMDLIVATAQTQLSSYAEKIRL